MPEKYKPTHEEGRNAESMMTELEKANSNEMESATEGLLEKRQEFPALENILAEIQCSITTIKHLDLLHAMLFQAGNFYKIPQFHENGWDEFHDLVQSYTVELRAEVERMLKINKKNPFWTDLLDWVDNLTSKGSGKGRYVNYDLHRIIRKSREDRAFNPEENAKSKIMDYMFNDVARKTSEIDGYIKGLESAARRLVGISK